MISVCKGLWDTQPLEVGTGYTWTLASRIGDMLRESEKIFGARDKEWTILGAEINLPGSSPQNWYPGGGERKAAVLQLVPPADKDMVVACYQLAHEVVHALSPLIGIDANVLEEGVVTWFSMKYVEKHFGQKIHPVLASYDDACKHAASFLKKYPDGVRRLRAVEPCFKKMTSATFAAARLVLPVEEVDALLSPFVR